MPLWPHVTWAPVNIAPALGPKSVVRAVFDIGGFLSQHNQRLASATLTSGMYKIPLHALVRCTQYFIIAIVVDPCDLCITYIDGWPTGSEEEPDWDRSHVIICSPAGAGCSGHLDLRLTWQSEAQQHPDIGAELLLDPLQVSTPFSVLRPLAPVPFYQEYPPWLQLQIAQQLRLGLLLRRMHLVCLSGG